MIDVHLFNLGVSTVKHLNYMWHWMIKPGLWESFGSLCSKLKLSFVTCPYWFHWYSISLMCTVTNAYQLRTWWQPCLQHCCGLCGERRVSAIIISYPSGCSDINCRGSGNILISEQIRIWLLYKNNDILCFILLPYGCSYETAKF